MKPFFRVTPFLIAAGLIFALLPDRIKADEIEPDLTTPAVQKLRTEWLAERTKLDEQYAAALTELLEQQTGEAEEMLRRARVSGNITQQAIARTANQILEQATEKLKSDGKLVLPETVRRELRPMVEQMRQKGTEIAAVQTEARSKLELATANTLQQLLADQETPVEAEEAATLLQQLEGVEVAAPEAEGEGQAEGEEGGEAAPKEELPKEPAEIASTGMAGDWESLLLVNIHVSLLEVISIPVVGVGSDREYTDRSMGDGSEIPIRLQPSNELLDGNASLVFRAMSVPGFSAPDIVAWPSARNNWELELRCRPHSTQTHALRLEVSSTNARLRRVAGAADEDDEEDNTPRVAVQVDTRPEGAAVYIDGRLQLKGRVPLRTPCEVQIRETGGEVTLRLTGYLAANLGKIVPREGQPVRAVLTSDPDYYDKTVRVQAAMAGRPSGISLKAGQRVRLTVSGQWACGSGGEMVGPEGYSVDKFPNYYINPKLSPRITTDAAYGALLVRIGTGPWKPVGRTLVFQAPASGPLTFEINEAQGKRMDNKGVLDVGIKSVQ